MLARHAVAVAVLALASTAATQTPSSLSAAAVVDRGCGLQPDGDLLWGLGPDYKVRFGGADVEFTPALGTRVERDLPLRFAFTACGRGDGSASTPAASRPRRTADALTVRYEHGACSEQYEVRSEGVEQSFTFAELPVGTGDLWVRGRIDTALAATVTGWTDRLEFLVEGCGGVRFGEVTGIDARGRRVRGSMRYRGGELELRLPAGFVDAAALPLVLDPLVGSAVLPGAGDDEYPDIAWHSDGTANAFLAVWHIRFSNNDTDVRGQRLDPANLSLVGPVIGIRTGSTLASDFARVAVVSLRDRFVVCWRERSGSNPSYLAASSVSLTGAVSPPLQVVSSATDWFADVDLGGDEHDLGDWAIAVYANTTLGQIETIRLVVAVDGTLSRQGRAVLAAGQRPRISHLGGNEGRYMAVWTQRAGLTDAWVEGAVIDRFTAVRELVAVTPSGGDIENNPHVDGADRHWIVAYDLRPGGADPDVFARWVTYDPRADDAYLGAPTAVASGRGVRTGPVVGYFYASAVVMYLSQRSGAVYDARVTSIDHFSCAPCEGTFTLDTSGDTLRGQSAGRGPYGTALIWEAQDSVSNGDVKVALFDQDAGFTISGQGSCGPPVAVYGTCLRSGHSAFALRMEQADAGRPALLILSGRPSAFACGACTVLDPFRSLLLPVGSTDARGDLAVPIPVPAGLAFVSLRAQFAYLPATGGGGCPDLGVSFSDQAFLTSVD